MVGHSEGMTMTEFTRRGVLTGAGTAIGIAAIAGCASTSSASPAGAGSGTSGPATGTSSTATPTGTGAGAALDLPAGPLSAVPVGGAALVSVNGFDLVITQLVAGRPSVFLNRCPHAGCKVAVDGAALVCPCHGSTFDLAGKVLQGPATSPLRAGSLRVTDGQIIVEKV